MLKLSPLKLGEFRRLSAQWVVMPLAQHLASEPLELVESELSSNHVDVFSLQQMGLSFGLLFVLHADIVRLCPKMLALGRVEIKRDADIQRDTIQLPNQKKLLKLSTPAFSAFCMSTDRVYTQKGCA